MLFDFLQDLGNYEERCVGRFDDDKTNTHVSTARVSDAAKPFETAVSNIRYRPDGKWIIVETYDTIDQAKAGHEKWVNIMTSENLPDQLEDVGLSEVGVMARELGGPEIYVRRDS